MYLMRRPARAAPYAICSIAENSAVRAIAATIRSAAIDCCAIPAASPDKTAAAGAHGAVMNPSFRLTIGATMPRIAAPIMPAIAPALTSEGDAEVKITTPNAMDEGTATSIAAKPPQKSPGIVRLNRGCRAAVPVIAPVVTAALSRFLWRTAALGCPRSFGQPRAAVLH